MHITRHKQNVLCLLEIIVSRLKSLSILLVLLKDPMQYFIGSVEGTFVPAENLKRDENNEIFDKYFAELARET